MYAANPNSSPFAVSVVFNDINSVSHTYESVGKKAMTRPTSFSHDAFQMAKLPAIICSSGLVFQTFRRISRHDR